MIICLAVICIFAAPVIFTDYYNYRNTISHALDTLTQIVGKNSRAALLFGDEPAAQDILASLKTEQNVAYACILDRDDTLFAQYVKAGWEPHAGPVPEMGSGVRFKKNYLTAFHPIVLNDETIGSIYIKYELSEFASRLRHYGALTLFLILVSCGVAFVLSNRLQRIITLPILRLTDIAGAVSQDKNYSLRAAKDSDDEIGILIDGFNEMLGQIQDREHQLKMHRDRLEDLVEQRTQELRAANEELRATRDQLDKIIADSIDCIIVTDSAGVINRANKAFSTMLGFPEEESIGKLISNFIPYRIGEYESTAGERFQVDDTLRKAAHAKITVFLDQKRSVQNWETHLVHKNGMVIPVDINMVVLQDEQQLIGSVAIIRDITERRKAELQIMRQSAVLEAINTVFQEMITCETDEDVARTCLALSEKLTKSRFGWIGELNETGTLDTIALSDPGWDACRIPESDKGRLITDLHLQGLWGSVLKNGASLKTDNPSKHPDSTGVPEGHPPLETFMGVPLFYEDKPFGLIALANKSGGYTEADVRDIETLALPYMEALMRKRTTITLDTERKQLLSIFDSMNAAIYVIDTDSYQLLFVNRYMRETLGIDPEQGTCYEVMMGFAAPCDFCTKKLLAEDPAKTYRWEYYSPALDKHFIVHDRMIKWSDGRSAKFSMSLDITDRKQNEQKIRRFAADLERSNQELNDFAYIASHDLKEPLRGIHNYASFLIEDYGEKLDAEGNRMLTTLTTLSERLETLIEGLLEYSRMGRLDLSFRETDLNALVADVVETLTIRLTELGIDIRIPHPLPTIQCDATRIQEVFRNLITNAMKYNDKNEKWIEIGYEDRPSLQVPVLYVRDNGIGIPQKHQEAIFKIFKRLHAREKFGGGTGAGLPIVKKIIERHLGRIWVESEPDTGTTFYFTLQNAQKTTASEELD